MAQKPSLGKGLASLFPGVAPVPPPQSIATGAGATQAGPAMSVEIPNKDRHPGITLASLDEIETNPNQPRREFESTAIQELADSIRNNGLIQPLVVRKNSSGKYELIAGERRLRASKIAGLKQVPVVIRRSTDRESLELALVENIQRQDLNCIDEALAYFQLIEEFSLSQEDVATQVGKDRASVANHLRLLRLPESIIDDLKKQILSFGHGKALLSLEDQDLRLRARKEIIENKLSVRQAEALVDRLKTETRAEISEIAKPKTPIQERLANLARDLGRRYSARVDLKGTERRGKIIIQYNSREELDRLVEAMHK